MSSAPEPSYETDTFDIFRGRSYKDAQWVEAVVGLASARRRMEEIAAQEPGDYFIFREGAMLASISNGAVASPSQPQKAGAA
jgi:hypothetical protein